MKSLLALIPYLKKFKKKFTLGFVFIILSNSTDSLYPLLIGAAIDDLTAGTLRHSMLTYALVGVCIVIMRGIFLFMTRQTLIVTSREIENDLRYDFFAH